MNNEATITISKAYNGYIAAVVGQGIIYVGHDIENQGEGQPSPP